MVGMTDDGNTRQIVGNTEYSKGDVGESRVRSAAWHLPRCTQQYFGYNGYILDMPYARRHQITTPRQISLARLLDMSDNATAPRITGAELSSFGAFLQFKLRHSLPKPTFLPVSSNQGQSSLIKPDQA
jgi:hypothetical protein